MMKTKLVLVALLVAVGLNCGGAGMPGTPGAQKPIGAECRSNPECRSNLCVLGLTESVCFEKSSAVCIQLGPATSLPISQPDFTIECPSARPRAYMCGANVKVDTLCEASNSEEDLEGFRFFCCPSYQRP